jgi:hypothetical protein
MSTAEPPETLPTFLSEEAPRFLVFGTHTQKIALFAFDVSKRRCDREYPVIAWINELGLYRESFVDFLGLILQLCKAELAELVQRDANETAMHLSTAAFATSA